MNDFAGPPSIPNALTSVPVLMRQGISLIGSERIDEAEVCFQCILSIDQDSADAHYWLGASYLHRGRHELAESHLRTAIDSNPRHADAHARLGLLLTYRGDYAQALQCFDVALAIAPKHLDALCNRGLALHALQRWKDAAHSLMTAISIRPSARLYSNLGALLADMGDERQAEQCYQHAIALEPLYSPAHDNLGVLRADQGCRHEAEVCFRQALLNANNAQAQLNLAHLLLADGRMEEGWRYYEIRYSPRLPGKPIFVPDVPYPQWQGESLAGKSILVWLEQGLGDELQFCRYIPVLKQMGARRVSFVCRPELRSLLATLHGVDVLVDINDKAIDLSGHDYWSFTMSLARCCNTTLATIPAEIPYLRVPDTHTKRWQSKFDGADFRVGLVWRGNPNHHNDKHRSLASLAVLAPLWSVPGIQFFSLQKGVGESDPPIAGLPIVDLAPDICDFADTAAAVAQMDLIICVDTSVAHLAGALGLPCWLLLPAHHPDWRWMLDRTDTPWYPTLRLWRQKQVGAWREVVEDMRLALRAQVAARCDHQG